MPNKPPNDHAIVLGMSGSGKSTLMIDAIVEEADRGDTAIVIEDPHPNSLGRGALEKLIAKGHGKRILHDRLDDLDSFLGFDFLKPSTSSDPRRRYAQNESSIEFFVQVLTRRREQTSLATSPLTEEWTLNAAWLYVEQSPVKSLADLHHLFHPKDPVLAKFIDDCRDPMRAVPFKKIYDGKASVGQIAPARRLVERVCRSHAFAIRCGRTFDFDEFLSRKGILILEGGSVDTLSSDALRIMLGAVSQKTLEYVRKRHRPFPRVAHYLDEANNYGLVGEHECHALAELRKNNYGCKIIVQTLDFPNTTITENVLNNTGTHIWFCCSSAKLAQQAASDLGDPALKERLRGLPRGECYIKTPGHYQHYKHQMGEDPWTFPGLSKKKADAYLAKIRQRPEYGSSGKSETLPSSVDSKPIPVRSNTTSTISPAERLRIAGTQSSEQKGESNSSEASCSKAKEDPATSTATDGDQKSTT